MIHAFLQEQQKIKDSDSEDITMYLMGLKFSFSFQKHHNLLEKSQPSITSLSNQCQSDAYHAIKPSKTWKDFAEESQDFSNMMWPKLEQWMSIWCLSCHQTKQNLKGFCRGESRFHWLVIETWPDLTNATWCGPRLVPDMLHSVIELYLVPCNNRGLKRSWCLCNKHQEQSYWGIYAHLKGL